MNENVEAGNGTPNPEETPFAAEPAKAAKPAEAATAAKAEAEEVPSERVEPLLEISEQPTQKASSADGDASGQPAFSASEPQIGYAPPSGAPVQPACQPNPATAAYQPMPATSPYASASSGYSPETDPVRPYSSYTQGGTGAQTGGKGNGTAALVCGILAIAFCGFPIVGVILGIVAIVLATKAVKRSGKNGKTTAGKICGIIGLVLSVLMFVLGLALAIWGATYLSNPYDVGRYGLTGPSEKLEEFLSDGNAGSDDEEIAELAARKAVEQKLDALASGDDAEIAAIADLADSGFYEQLGLHFSEIGIDSEEYARWITERMSYSIDDVYLHEEENNEVATVYVDITTRDVFAFIDELGTTIDDFANSPEGDAISSDEELNAALENLFRTAMISASSNDYTTNFAMFTVIQRGSSWVVDQDTWDYEIDYMFGLV